MLEARMTQGLVLKKIIEIVKDIIGECNIDCTPTGISMQAMDKAHVILVMLQLRNDGFESFRCDRSLTVGVSMTSLGKLMKCASNDDIITLKADDMGDTLNMIFESPNNEKVADYDLKLMDLDTEHLGVPDMQYDFTVKMNSNELQRICRDLLNLSESVTIDGSKESVKFTSNGDVGSGSIILRQSTSIDKEEASTKIIMQAPCSVALSLKFLSLVSKAASLSETVTISVVEDSPVLLEYPIADMGHLRFYLAPKLGDDETEPASMSAATIASADLGRFSIPEVKNEPLKTYAPGSLDRIALQNAIKEMQSQTIKVPCIVNGEKIMTGRVMRQEICADHKYSLCTYHQADASLVKQAIDGALSAKTAWEYMPFVHRAAIFLKAADLIAHRYRYKLMAAAILGQGKTAWQAEIDAAAELADFLRFNCKFAAQIYAEQPPENAATTWNRMEYRPLDGFVLAVSPFNFTAIGGNLSTAPALMGNVVLWKPAASALYSNYIVYEILMEAGLPPGVIQFIPGPPEEIVDAALKDPRFSGLHFTGSTAVFKKLWRQISNNLDIYQSYPRIVGETGGKNMHFVHASADISNVVNQTIRGAFEYQGQKCSACSRMYVPDSLWPEIKKKLIEETEKVVIGQTTDMATFCGPVINKAAYEKIMRYLEEAKTSKEAKIISGGTGDCSVGYFITPTIIETSNLDFVSMKEEIFGPVLSVFAYPEKEYEKYLRIAADSSDYALTASIFAQERSAIQTATEILRSAAGNFYINDKCTGAIVGQQPFGGGKMSGTNDKAGSALNLYRWVSPRTIKESYLPLDNWCYPGNQK